MTLEEAIKHAEEKAEELRNEAEHYEIAGVNVYGCEECAKEHDQLAEWLRDYKRLKEQEPCEDAISREAVLDLCDSKDPDYKVIHFKEDVECLPSVNPQPKTGHCKDCKWWKDSDGLYRRGGHAESQCPINRREVFEGNGYCYMFEPR